MKKNSFCPTKAIKTTCNYFHFDKIRGIFADENRRTFCHITLFHTTNNAQGTIFAERMQKQIKRNRLCRKVQLQQKKLLNR